MTGSNLSDRQAVLLVFIGDVGERLLDPVRIMKGLFLVAEDTPVDWLPKDARYRFEPYLYGPYSQPIYSDLALLERLGLVQTTAVPGRSWKYYSLTSEGADVADEAAATMNQKLVAYLHRMRAYVTDLPFDQLLRAVYSKHPAYAVNSVFKD